MAKVKKGLLKAECNVKGVGVEYLPIFLNRKGVSTHKINKLGDEEYNLLIDFCDLHKFFAICQNMCYNKKVVKYKGILSPVTWLIKHAGLFIGAVLFTVLVALLNNLILKVEVVGSGSCYEEETVKVLSENGARKYAVFSALDYDDLASVVLRENKSLSFVSIKKDGNKLVVNTVASQKEPSVLGGEIKDLLSPCQGVVEKVSVWRGTSLVKAGDLVDKGTVLVGAYHLLKEGVKSPTYVVARITVIESREYFYKAQNYSEENIKVALMLAEFYIGDEIIEKTPIKSEGGITVKLKVRHTVYGG